jgi:uncharacterized protein (TIGR03790 family)
MQKSSLGFIGTAAGWLWAAAASAVLAGGGPQNVAVIVNPNDPHSLAVANAYVELRQIPGANVIYIPWKLDARSTTGAKFRDLLLKPAFDELKRRDVIDHIDAFAFSSGYPYLIECTALFPGEEFPRQARPVASLTSAAYLYQFILNAKSAMFAPNSNLYFAATADGHTPSRSCSTRQKWNAAGQPVADDGMKYLLATALGVTHGHGNTVEEIIASLQRSRAADGTRPPGTIYYMRNKDIRSRARDAGFQSAVQELAAAGVKGVIQEGVVPRGAPDVAGLTTGQAHVDVRSSGSKLLPGALVDNLTSAGGQMLIRVETNPQTRISEYIRLGAAGASGTVVEPFAIWQKFPTPAIHVHYARGCSLAESFYQSISSPAQLLIIGDPLCQPWATPPVVTATGLKSGPLSGEVTIVPTAKYPDARKASRFELFIGGVRKATATPGEPLKLDTKSLPDGWHEVRVIAIDNTPIAVQGALTKMVEIRNGEDAVGMVIAEPRRFPLDGVITVNILSTRDGEFRLMHNGRQLATVAAGSGKVEVEAKQLGRGNVQFYVEQAGQPPLRSRPLTIVVN